MGIVGIIGSTSLILCGFGLMNSINAMLDKAFNDTVKYNVEIKLRIPSTDQQLSGIYDALSSAKNIDATMAFSVYLYAQNGNVQSPYVVVMDEEQKASTLRI